MKAEAKCTCDLRALNQNVFEGGTVIRFELELVRCPLHEAAPDLLRAAHAAWHLCAALHSCKDGVTMDLIDEIRDALHAALTKAKEKPE